MTSSLVTGQAASLQLSLSSLAPQSKECSKTSTKKLLSGHENHSPEVLEEYKEEYKNEDKSLYCEFVVSYQNFEVTQSLSKNTKELK